MKARALVSLILMYRPHVQQCRGPLPLSLGLLGMETYCHGNLLLKETLCCH